jgi:hypothetical protein
MIQKETPVVKDILATVGVGPTRLFRNVVAKAWVGKIKSPYKNGEVSLFLAHPIQAGLIDGSGDTIGWTTITVTPEMVGKQVALFTSIEAKTMAGSIQDNQIAWQTNVCKAGGFAIIARSGQDALSQLKNICTQFTEPSKVT